MLKIDEDIDTIAFGIQNLIEYQFN